MKKILKSTIISIGMAMTIFCFVGVIFDIIYEGNFSLENYQFTKMVIACVVIGLGFGIPSIVYESDKLPFPLKVVVHMGIGITVYTAAAYFAGWFTPAVSIPQGIGIIAIQFMFVFIIWLGFMKHYANEAREMNEKIQKLQNHER